MTVKRVVDLTVATCALVVTSPFLVLIGVAIRLESSGPALFRQRRVGRYGREFEILKFRSMRHGGAGPLLTADGDHRITRIGALLRASKLDELPQLWNVVRGDMSIVGPRPELPRYMAMYSPQQREVVLSVRPGITDEASIQFADESTLLAGADDPELFYATQILPRKIQLYQEYVAKQSAARDVGIVVRTLARLLKRGRAKPQQ
jgi:lipopolysaccharide/colanic/teichoic acid biosynthesis glycosyltransferase